MRKLSIWALVLLAIAALAVFPLTVPCYGLECLLRLVPFGVLGLSSLIGFGLALSATILGIVRAVKRRQWRWCVGLVVAILAPLPAGLLLSGDVFADNGSSVLRALPLSTGLVLTPAVALIYSVRYPRRVAAEPSASPVPLPSVEPMGETNPPLDAP